MLENVEKQTLSLQNSCSYNTHPGMSVTVSIKTHVFVFLRSLRNFPAFEAEGLKPLKSAVFPRDAQKNKFPKSAKSQKNRRGRRVCQKNTP